MTPAIEVEHLQCRFGAKVIFQDLNLRINQGSTCALLGANGVGKTTLLAMLVGALEPSAGSIRIDGYDPRKFAQPLHQVGFHFDVAALHPHHSPRRHLQWMATALGVDKQRVDMLIHHAGLEAFAHRRLKHCSLGIRQRAGIASAMLADPPILLFDEPLNGLDLQGILWFRGLLDTWRAEAKTVVLSTHDLPEAQRSVDQVCIIADKQVRLQAGMEQVLATFGGLEPAMIAHIPELAGR
ncbi:ABC transporter ATP-binding protein [Corynebacterium gerontici]|uniref:Taurine import ATP-binding protein TauB n=1 Tax=Corynebacterium gerontici TaxID=2079234 RepID=A0A3G6IYF5_9CORY|nr:ATP-binding cassette domain-containing protein [Corynebacterium gerontici]AZA10732.1 Taurine import ATP-binding protein TauB [Corynebacterium gerontici]